MRQEHYIRATITAARRAGYAIRVTTECDSFIGSAFQIRKRPGDPALNFLNADAWVADELPLKRIIAVESLERTLSDILDERLQRHAGVSHAETYVEISPELVQRIDAQRGSKPRERYILQAIEARLYRDGRDW